MDGAKPRPILPRIKNDLRHWAYRLAGKRSLHFLHIGKTGGSALKHVLTHYPTASRYVLHLHPHTVRLRDVPERDGVIFFVRDPISRFVSGFYSRQRQGQPRIFSPWRPDERAAFERFETANALAAALSDRDEEVREAAAAAMRAIHHVSSGYWDWFGDERYFRSRIPDIFFIGAQEHLARDFEVLKGKLGLPPGARLPSDDTIAHRNPQDIDRTLEPLALENLTSWYREDYRFLDICREITAQS